MARQLSCRDMYKFMTCLYNQKHNYNKEKFPKITIVSWLTLCEMCPWHGAPDGPRPAHIRHYKLPLDDRCSWAAAPSGHSGPRSSQHMGVTSLICPEDFLQKKYLRQACVPSSPYLNIFELMIFHTWFYHTFKTFSCVTDNKICMFSHVGVISSYFFDMSSGVPYDTTDSDTLTS